MTEKDDPLEKAMLQAHHIQFDILRELSERIEKQRREIQFLEAKMFCRTAPKIYLGIVAHAALVAAGFALGLALR